MLQYRQIETSNLCINGLLWSESTHEFLTQSAKNVESVSM